MYDTWLDNVVVDLLIDQLKLTSVEKIFLSIQKEPIKWRIKNFYDSFRIHRNLVNPTQSYVRWHFENWYQTLILSCLNEFFLHVKKKQSGLQ